MYKGLLITIAALYWLCNSIRAEITDHPFVVVLGITQDGGYPHIGCEKMCCVEAWENDSLQKNVVSIALVDPQSKQWWLFEATPDITAQLQLFSELTNHTYNYMPDGIFITHAHIGHYTGLMELGREALNSKSVPVYVLPRMQLFLESNGPWSQLVNLRNIEIRKLQADSLIHLTETISILPFTVPHRDDYSETAGFKITTSEKDYLFIPDINKWSSFDRDIITLVKETDIAFLDGTFYSGEELGNIDIDEVPHPFIIETMRLFADQEPSLRGHIYFIHFNHTNPLLRKTVERDVVFNSGFHIAEQGCFY